MKRLAAILIFAAALVWTPAGTSQTKVYRTVANETIEKILQGLEAKYQKEERKNNEYELTIKVAE